MRTTCSRLYTKILPSPILPVRAAASTASITRSTNSSATAASIFTLGRKSTTYSAPRYSSVWPFWRPKPFTSVTVMPWTPIAESASRTSSSLNGLMMAVTSFMGSPISVAALERFLDVGHAATSRRVQSRQIGIEKAGGVVAGVIGAELDVLEQAFGYGVRDAGFPVGVRRPGVTAAIVPHIEVANVAEQRKAGIADRIGRRQVVIAGAVGLLARRLNPEVVAADGPRALEA